MYGRILVVDDEHNQRRSLSIALQLEGFEVFEAEDGESALRKLQAIEVDVAIIDLMMPGLNGLDLSRRIRFRYPNVSIVLTSAYQLTEKQLSLSGLDSIAFVSKPYCLDALSGFLKGKIDKVRKTAHA
ncbi:MAG: response regulator [Deltaproteobacteria bacterium]|nr:response regulator [Deltaproteobacteria bacterium]